MASMSPRDQAILTAFGRNVRSARMASGRSAGDFAEAVGIDRTTLHRLERGQSNPGLTIAVRIAGVLEARIEDLLDRPR